MRQVFTCLLVFSALAIAMPAFAQQSDIPPGAATESRAATESTEAAAGGFSCSGCTANTWVWQRVQEAWRYESGSEERIWCYIQGNSNYAYVSTADARHRMFIEAASSNHWLGLFYLGSSTFSNVRLWFN